MNLAHPRDRALRAEEVKAHDPVPALAQGPGALFGPMENMSIHFSSENSMKLYLAGDAAEAWRD